MIFKKEVTNTHSLLPCTVGPGIFCSNAAMAIIGSLLAVVFGLMSGGCQGDSLVNGAKSPDIVLPAATGDSLRLSEVAKGKVVLVDFWASWCKPCREAHPELRRIYSEFKDKKMGNATGFTIYSVSLDSQNDAWQAAVQADSLFSWPNLVIDTRAFGSPYTDVFQFGQIPTAYLVDERGVIIGKNLSLKWLAYELRRREGD